MNPRRYWRTQCLDEPVLQPKAPFMILLYENPTTEINLMIHSLFQIAWIPGIAAASSASISCGSLNDKMMIINDSRKSSLYLIRNVFRFIFSTFTSWRYKRTKCLSIPFPRHFTLWHLHVTVTLFNSQI